MADGERKETVVRFMAGLGAALIAVGTIRFPCLTCEPVFLGLNPFWWLIIALFVLTVVLHWYLNQPESSMVSTMLTIYAAVNVGYLGYTTVSEGTEDKLFTFIVINLLFAGIVVLTGSKVGRLIARLLEPLPENRSVSER